MMEAVNVTKTSNKRVLLNKKQGDDEKFGSSEERPSRIGGSRA